MRHRSFLLRPEERTGRTFAEYQRTGRRAAGEQDVDSPSFHIPAVGDPYPRGSFPALEAAAWVREHHAKAFPAFDLALFEAFFGRAEDISDRLVLERIAAAVGLDPSGLTTAVSTGKYRPTVMQEHLEATSQGIHGVPTVLIPGQPPIVGAVPYDHLKRAVERGLTGDSAGPRVDPVTGRIVIQEGNAQF